jgi:NADH:ubiquinone oxidoreductase subunit E
MVQTELTAILAGREGQSDQLIEVLQDMQAQLNYLPEEGLRLVAETLGVAPIEVFRVANFYKAFSLEPRGRHLLTVCTGTACHVRGSPRLVDAAEGDLAVSPGETTEDGAFTLEGVNCLGCCALGPVVILDGVYHDHMTPAKLRKLIASIREEDENGAGKDA